MARTDSAFRVIDAPPDRVFAALLDPQALSMWLPPRGMTGQVEHFDPCPRGVIPNDADLCPCAAAPAASPPVTRM